MSFWFSLNVRSNERNTENTILHLYFNEESDYFEETTCENEVFRSTMLYEETKHIHALASDLLHTVLE